jgi:hypothetical protein
VVRVSGLDGRESRRLLEESARGGDAGAQEMLRMLDAIPDWDEREKAMPVPDSWEQQEDDAAQLRYAARILRDRGRGFIWRRWHARVLEACALKLELRSRGR